MAKVKKADAFKALESILNNAMLNDCQHAEDMITIVRFIEQQWESESETLDVYRDGDKVTEIEMKGEGTI